MYLQGGGGGDLIKGGRVGSPAYYVLLYTYYTYTVCICRDNREWYGGSPYPQKSDHSTTNHLSEQNSGYQSSGHLNNSPNIHTNSVYHPTGRPDSYSSPVYPTNVSHNSYTPARHPDMGYPGKRPVSSGHLSNGPPPGPTNQTSCPPPHENGYRDDVRLKNGIKSFYIIFYLT